MENDGGQIAPELLPVDCEVSAAISAETKPRCGKLLSAWDWS